MSSPDKRPPDKRPPGKSPPGKSSPRENSVISARGRRVFLGATVSTAAVVLSACMPTVSSTVATASPVSSTAAADPVVTAPSATTVVTATTVMAREWTADADFDDCLVSRGVAPVNPTDDEVEGSSTTIGDLAQLEAEVAVYEACIAIQVERRENQWGSIADMSAEQNASAADWSADLEVCMNEHGKPLTGTETTGPDMTVPDLAALDDPELDDAELDDLIRRLDAAAEDLKAFQSDFEASDQALRQCLTEVPLPPDLEAFAGVLVPLVPPESPESLPRRP